MFMSFLLSARGCLAVLPFGNTHNTTGVRILPAVFFGILRIKISDTNKISTVMLDTDLSDFFVFILGDELHSEEHF